MVKLDILSDPICPWCYIGKTLMDRAFDAAAEVPFVVEWHPFQLNPDMPPEGRDRREYLETKFGGKEQAVQVYGRIADAAEAAGLMINFAAIDRTPNTLNAHRLIHWAGQEQVQGPVVDELFAAYFERGEDIGDSAVLVQIAKTAGMDPKVVARMLDTDVDAQDIRDRDAHSRERGVTGVPTFVVANQHVLQGAQSPELWANAIAEVQAALASAEAEAEAEAPTAAGEAQE